MVGERRRENNKKEEQIFVGFFKFINSVENYVRTLLSIRSYKEYVVLSFCAEYFSQAEGSALLIRFGSAGSGESTTSTDVSGIDSAEVDNKKELCGAEDSTEINKTHSALNYNIINQPC